MTPAQFGTLLKRYRLAAGLSQSELAERALISARAISDLERGINRAARRDTLRRLMEALQLAPEERAALEAAARGAGGADGNDAVPGTAEPTAINTFLLADVRGYTRYTEEQGDEAAAGLAARFAEVVADVVDGRNGTLLELRGDEALAVFSSARHALRAAVELQRRFARELERDPSLPLRVGIGLDAGEAVPVAGGYRGGALNLAARLCSLAAAGEVLASDSVIHLARKTEGLLYLDRGETVVKGLADPVRVMQIVPDDAIPADMPRFTIDRPRRTNLPAEPTPFIGRKQEVVDIMALLHHDDVRLLTLSGAGGIGKTRLALHVAGNLLDTFADGVFLVSLASIADPDLALTSLVTALDVKEVAGQPLEQTLRAYLTDKRMLLIFDNFEHVLPAVRLVGDLLASCRQLKILVTSRAVLRIGPEHVYDVPSLTVPDLQRPPDLETLAQYDAVAFFGARAWAAQGSFALTTSNAQSVAAICARLDGLPLALELAAARIRLFSPQALLRRLSSRLDLLTGGARDAPTRQKTLRDTIDWSYNLLDGAEQTLFARLSVFPGDCTLEAAEAVCNVEGEIEHDVLTGVLSLVEQSLLRQDPGENGESRLTMLGTIREYARERLLLTAEAERIEKQHAEYYLSLAQGAQRQVRGPHVAEALDLLERERNNVRAALQWSLDHGEVELGLRISGALEVFWLTRGPVNEGRKWLEALLARTAAVQPAVRAEALGVAATLAAEESDLEAAARFATECLMLRRHLGDRRSIAHAVNDLAVVLCVQGEYERAGALLEESMKLFEELNDSVGSVRSLSTLGVVAIGKGDYAGALKLFEKSLALCAATGYERGMAMTLTNLGWTRWAQGDDVQATAMWHQALQAWNSVGDRTATAICFEGLAAVAGRHAAPERAAHLLGAAERLREDGVVARIHPLERSVYTSAMESRAQSDDLTWVAAWQAGRVMPLEQALAYALADRVQD